MTSDEAVTCQLLQMRRLGDARLLDHLTEVAAAAAAATAVAAALRQQEMRLIVLDDLTLAQNLRNKKPQNKVIREHTVLHHQTTYSLEDILASVTEGGVV